MSGVPCGVNATKFDSDSRIGDDFASGLTGRVCLRLAAKKNSLLGIDDLVPQDGDQRRDALALAEHRRDLPRRLRHIQQTPRRRQHQLQDLAGNRAVPRQLGVSELQTADQTRHHLASLHRLRDRRRLLHALLPKLAQRGDAKRHDGVANEEESRGERARNGGFLSEFEPPATAVGAAKDAFVLLVLLGGADRPDAEVYAGLALFGRHAEPQRVGFGQQRAQRGLRNALELPERLVEVPRGEAAVRLAVHGGEREDGRQGKEGGDQNLAGEGETAP